MVVPQPERRPKAGAALSAIGPLLIRADGGAGLGTGHVMRCLALGQEWRARGGAVHLAAAFLDPALRRRVEEDGVQVHPLPCEPGSQADARATVDLARRLTAQWVVLDGYTFPPTYQRTVRAGARRLMLIDDHGRFGEHRGDLLVDTNHATEAGLYPQRGPGTRLLLGTRYVLLRDEFLRQPRRLSPTGSAKRVLVSFGGAPPISILQRCEQALAGLPLQVDIVLGSAGTAVAGAPPPNVRRHADVRTMASLMAACDLAVTAAGTSSWELCYLGVPFLMVPVAENQRPIVDALTAAGAARPLGWFETVTPHEIRKAVVALAADTAGRRRMAENGQVLVDGQGRVRVVDAMLEATP